jgi:hypothetical protein
MTKPTEYRYSGVNLDSNLGGLTLSINGAGLLVPDPDDPNRIIVVPLTAAKLIFAPALVGAKANVPEGW